MRHVWALSASTGALAWARAWRAMGGLAGCLGRRGGATTALERPAVVIILIKVNRACMHLGVDYRYMHACMHLGVDYRYMHACMHLGVGR